MNLADAWAELAAGAPSATSSGRRRITSPGQPDVYATLTVPGNRYGLGLTVVSTAVPPDIELPATRGMSHVMSSEAAAPERVTLELQSADDGAADAEIFTAVATDVALHTQQALDDGEAVERWIGRVARWITLLSRAPGGLSDERQRGLYGELFVLSNRLAPPFGPGASVRGWTGPAGGHDFQLRGGAIEVKTSSTHRPQTMTISSERQLDDAGIEVLLVAHLSLDVRQHAGQSLPEIVDQVRRVAAGADVRDELEDRLLDAGYADVHAPHYARTGYVVRDESVYHVSDGFPRIVEDDLPDGVGDVHYKVVIDLCRPFEMTWDAAAAAIAGLR